MAKTKEIIQTDDVFTGAASALVSVVAYVDYESHRCAQLNEVLNQLLLAHAGRIKVNIRHFPLTNKHQKAMKAAEAVVAAMQEGLLWPMNNALFSNQKKLGVISLQQHAKTIGIQNKRFLEQVINGTYAWQVREDLMDGLKKGIRDVPAVFINGEQYEGEISMESLVAAIALKR